MSAFKHLGPDDLSDLRVKRDNAYREYHELDQQIMWIESDLSRQRQEQIHQHLKERDATQKLKP